MRHFDAVGGTQTWIRKVLRSGKNVLSFSPYGYSKEKCIFPSSS
jgi:hypothetical protein